MSRRKHVEQSWVLLAGVVLALSMLTACVEPGENTHVSRGTSPAAELTEELAQLGVTLPDERSHLEWLMVDTWDTNDTYVRLRGPRSSVRRLLDQSNIEESSLQPLGTAVDWQWALPQKVLSGVPTEAWGPAKDLNWSLTPAQRESAVAGSLDDGLRATDAVVIDLQSAAPLVMLHWYR